MDKSLCLYFQVHQPDRLRLYRFFDIGNDSHYYDDFANKAIMNRVVQRCYLPMNELLLELIEKFDKKFKVSFSITGSVIEQLQEYAPEVIASFKKLAKTGCVEFLAETYSHSLSSLKSETEFKRQIKDHEKLIEKLFGVKPTAFRNTELIYSDRIGEVVSSLGYNTMITEGAKHILGWKSPNYVYTNCVNPRLKLLLRNFELSDDISFRFADRSSSLWPLTAEKFANLVVEKSKNDDIINIFMDYETFGEHQNSSTGIFEFMRALPGTILNYSDIKFRTVSEAAAYHQPVAPLYVPFPISWADEERDTSAWIGNELQNEAFNKLYQLESEVYKLSDAKLTEDFRRLQESDHFYYMCTKFFSDGAVHKYFNPYDTPYEAFINYMNVLSDFMLRLKKKRENKDKKSKNTKTVKEK